MADIYEQRPAGVTPIRVVTVFLFLYVLNVAGWAIGRLGLLTGQSVQSRITLVLQKCCASPDGIKITISDDGHNFISPHCKAMKRLFSFFFSLLF